MKKILLFIVCITSSIVLFGQTHSSADKLFQEGEYGAAQEAYGALLKRYPTEALYLYRYARCAQELGDDTTAIQYFEAFNQVQRSSKLETNIDVARMTLAYSYLNKGEYEKALAQIQDLLANTTATILPKEDVLTNGFNNVDSENWIWGQDVTIENTSALASFFGQVDIYSYSYASAGDVKGIDANLLAEIDANVWDVRRGWWGNYYAQKNEASYEYAPDGKFFSAKSKELMGDRNWLSDNVFMRIETAYLIAAEAAYRENNYPLAAEYLTKITDERVKEGQEAAYAAYKATLTDSKVLEEAIYYNWRVELWGEGHTFFDIKRLNMSVTRGYEGTNWADSQSQLNTNGRPAWTNYVIVATEAANNAALVNYNNPDPSDAYAPWAANN